jgi:hypothetical protein
VSESESPGSDAGGARHDLGPDIARLVGAAQEWFRRAVPESAIGHGGPECQWCPICQLVNVVRGDSPEVAERLAEAGAALSAAVKALTDAAVRAQAQGRERPRPRPHVERIDLDDPGES